jgi:hypothetical protein
MSRSGVIHNEASIVRTAAVCRVKNRLASLGFIIPGAMKRRGWWYCDARWRVMICVPSHVAISEPSPVSLYLSMYAWAQGVYQEFCSLVSCGKRIIWEVYQSRSKYWTLYMLFHMAVELGFPPHAFIFPSSISLVDLTSLRTYVTSGRTAVRRCLGLISLWISSKASSLSLGPQNFTSSGRREVPLGFKRRSLKPVCHVSLTLSLFLLILPLFLHAI